MLIHPTVERLRALGLTAMADGFIELQNSPDAGELSREDWLGLLVDREATSRENKRLARRLREARLRQTAVVEDVNHRAHRGLDRALFQKLAVGDWLREHHHLVIIGPTGIGKSWLACALGHKACRDGFSVLYKRASRLFADLAQARGEGRLPRLLTNARTHPPADHRRLGPGTAQCRATPRSARDRRRSLRSRVAADHQPGPRESLA
jgi:DNA replication protein DnaC